MKESEVRGYEDNYGTENIASGDRHHNDDWLRRDTTTDHCNGTDGDQGE